MRTNTEALTARLDVLRMAMQEIARTLAPSQAMQITDATGKHSESFTSLTALADEAATAELASVLEALRASG